VLQWNHRPVFLQLPQSFADVLRGIDLFLLDPAMMPSDGKILLPLPLAVLLRLFPQMLAARVWARFLFGVVLGTAVLAALGVSRLTTRVVSGGAITVALAAVVLLEGLIAPYMDITRVADNARPVDVWLAAQDQGTTLIEYPFPLVSKLAMYAQAEHGQSVVNGYLSTNPSYLSEFATALGGWPTESSVEVLRKWGVQFVLVNGTAKDEFREQILPGIRAISGLCWLRKFDGSFMGFTEVHVFRVVRPGEACDA
jgi:hypothetical protein